MYRCNLESDLSRCPYRVCVKDGSFCSNILPGCGFRKEEIITEEPKYVRKERWYEQYYRGTRPV